MSCLRKMFTIVTILTSFLFVGCGQHALTAPASDLQTETQPPDNTKEGEQPGKPPEEQAITFNVVKSKVLTAKCLRCHTGGGMDLTSYGNAKRLVMQIQEHVEADTMPPGPNKLSAVEKKLVLDWIKAGAHE